MRNLDHLIKAYDVRGIVPDEWDAGLAREIGAAFARVVGAAKPEGPGAVVVGRDMRPTGPALVAAFTEGVNSEGVDVIDIGLCSTDGLYFAAGHLDLPGAMFTASHNPAEYNGIKMCRAGATPVGQESGLREIKAMVEEGVVLGSGIGTCTERDLLAEYGAYLRQLVDISTIRPLKVVIDAGNGMAGHTVPEVLGALPLEIVPLYFELDGTFPNHEANPIDPANMRDLQAAVLAHRADIGLAFDGDADRCFVVDEKGAIVDPSALTGLIAVRELAKAPGSTIIHNLITSAAVPEIIRENGGTPVVTRVGHSFIKATMAQTGAIFGGEHSGHFYFRDFWKADSGMLAALHTLAALGGAPAGTTLSGLLAPYSRYVASGEINSKVADVAAKTAQVRAAYEGPGVTITDLDGMTVTGDGWWFNLRPSNTEPLLRLNVEGRDPEMMERIRDEVLARVRAD